MFPGVDLALCAKEPSPRSKMEARGICHRCPVLEECQSWAVDNPGLTSWMRMVGGLTQQERFKRAQALCKWCERPLDTGPKNLRIVHSDCEPDYHRYMRRRREPSPCQTCGAPLPKGRRKCDLCRMRAPRS